ncbi:MAG TPA: 1-phosphofructokinase family hexose kinase [Solirubrobacteraceae bacterium]|nr:1-phosphofructokinase family hexose kinase [Solirubrobacteraceae bacterium]
MILTVTANIAIDRTYVVDRIEIGAVHKVAKTYAHTGGKGVNVARTVAALGGRAKVTGIVGANNFDDATRDLSDAGVDSALFAVDGPGRQTVTVTAQDGTTTAFDEPGPQVSADTWIWFARHVDGLLQEAQMVVIAGSLPPGSPDQSLTGLCRLANTHGVPVILDARGAAMRSAQKEKPLVAKLNRSELERTLGRELTSDDDILDAATQLHNEGAQSVVVTLAADGVIGLNGDGAWRVTHPAADGNPIGAGDAFSAALALALLADADANANASANANTHFEQALVNGAAAALASLTAPTAGALDPDEMQRVLPTVQIHQIREAAQR